MLAVASGINRVDEKRVGALLGEALDRADAAFVRAKTGFPPCAHAVPPVAFLDEDLFALDEIWAAAGTPNAIFRLTPGELERLTAGRIATVKTLAGSL